MNFSNNNNDDNSGYAITIEDIRAAADRLRNTALRTPLLESPLLNNELGYRLLVKAEPLQRTGSFKFRGAYNTISQLNTDARKAGVVAFSSGNHAQGVAAAANMLDVPATIVMPEDAPAIKIANTRAWGATVVLYDRYREDREAIGAGIAAETSATLVKPYDSPHVMAGQGTVGLEIAKQCHEAGLKADTVVVPCGGGGLSAGVTLAMANVSRNTEVWTAEPEGWDDTARSLKAGERLAVDGTTKTICDALLPPAPGKLTFPILRDLAAGGLAVDDQAVKKAMATAFMHFKLVVEPGGVAALAAVLDGKIDCRGKTVVCVCSGGNADPALFARILSEMSA
jgi:threonine dehydratase